ncbi:transcriptional regulator, IclR family [Geotalea uraniireducens Rf4]|uniref:Transcriptional regulator, IclR family n=1 Tax=Geotalea uraniireducens (strain Rf4) TaxID=351605 RepID=A5G7D3_GEOUR|nr:transcriptional regulator, IclR family [Geotalea uraniireducens Rf4]
MTTIRTIMKKEKSSYIIQTVIHALDLLEQFHGDVVELGVTELSKRLDLHKNNVFRLLATLESHNYIEQNRSTGSYRLGLKNLELGQTMIRQMGLLRQAKPVLETLTAHCHETSYVALLQDAHIIYLDAVESDLPVRVVPRVGARLPAYCTAAGKVHLAAMAAEELVQHLPASELERCTPHTIVNREELQRQLLQVVAQGYAIDDEELDVGVRCISAPIRDYTKRVVGALSISGPVMRFTAERIAGELVPLVRTGAAEVSARLGYS